MAISRISDGPSRKSCDINTLDESFADGIAGNETVTRNETVTGDEIIAHNEELACFEGGNARQDALTRTEFTGDRFNRGRN